MQGDAWASIFEKALQLDPFDSTYQTPAWEFRLEFEAFV